MSQRELIGILKLGKRSVNPESVANCALTYERFILETNPSMFLYCATLTEIQERTYGEFYYQEFVKPEASYYIRSDKEVSDFIFKDGHRPEQIFTCKGVLAVNLYHAYKLGFPLDINLYDIPTAIIPASKIYEVWYNELGDIAKTLVNYRYYRNLYEHTTTRIRLSRREKDLMRTFQSWRERYCRLNLRERFPPNPLEPTLILDNFL